LRTPTDSFTNIQEISEGSIANELVPLQVATRTISMRVYRRDGSPSRLTGIAHAIAALAPLYSHSSDGSEIRRIPNDEVLSGFFRKGGAELHFTDGRPPIANIAATNYAIELVISILATTVDGEPRH
jgi:hypothetical protein